MQSREDLKEWDGQTPPKGEVPALRNLIGKGLPHFGEFEKQRRKVY